MRALCPSLVQLGRSSRFILLLVAVASLVAPAGRAATNITIVAVGPGNLDTFLSPANGTITLANDPGDLSATLSQAALQAVGAGVPISISADNTITFQNLGTLSLLTGAGINALFQTTSGPISFTNTLNTVSTAGGNIVFNAGGTLTAASLNAGAGNVTLTAGSSLAINSTQGANVSLTSTAGSISSTGANAIQATGLLTLNAASGINVFSSVGTLRASNSTSGNVTITQTAVPAQVLSILLSGVSNSAAGGTISITNLGEGITVFSPVVSSNGAITLDATIPTGFKLFSTVNSGTATTNLGNSVAGTLIDLGSPVFGELSLSQSDLNNVTAAVLRIGTATAGTINVSAPITNPVTWATLALINNGPVTEAAAGSLTLPNLRVSSTGPVALTSANNVNVAAATSTNAFSLSNGTNGLTVGVVDGVTGIATSNSNLTLVGDNLLLNQAVNGGSGGIVTLEPFTLSDLIALGSPSGPGTFGLPDAALGNVTAGVLRIGSASDSGGMVVSLPITRHAGYSTLSLIDGGSLIQSGPLSVANLDLQVAAAILPFISNDVDALAGIANGGITYADLNGFTVGTVDGVSGLTAAGNTVVLSSGGPVSQNPGSGIHANSLELTGPGGYTLTDASNSVNNIAASVANSIAYTNAGSLTISTVVVSGMNSVSGSIAVTAGATTSGSTLTVGVPVVGPSGVTLTSDQMTLGAAVNGGANVVELQPTTAGRAVTLGGTVAGTLSILQSDLNNVIAGVLRIGNLNSSGPITITSPISDAALGWSTLSLLTEQGAGINQNAGATLTVTNLQAAGAAGVNLTQNNVVSNLAGASDGGTFAFTDMTNLTVTNVDAGLGAGFGSGIINAGGRVFLAVVMPNDSLTINQTIDTTHTFGFPSPGGADIALTADNMALNNNSPSSTIRAGTNGAVLLSPQTPSITIALGGPDAGGQLGIDDNDLTNTSGRLVRIGVLGIQTGAITVDGTVNTHAGYNMLSLIATGPGGAITQTTGSIAVANLALAAANGIGSAGAMQIVGPENLAFKNTTANNVQIHSTGAMTITANASELLPTSSNTAPGGTVTLVAASPMTFAVNTTSSGTLTATTIETASETGTPLPAPDDNININTSVVLQSTGGNVVITSADNIIIAPGASLVAPAGTVSYLQGVGDIDNDAASPPSISKSFGAASIPLNGSTSLTFAIFNPNPGAALTGIAFNDNLPAGLAFSGAPTNSCGGTVVVGASLSFTGGTLPAMGTCTVGINVTGTAAGTKLNISGAVTSTNGGTGNTANATLDVVAPPSIAKSFTTSPIPLNGTTALNFTVTNPNPAIVEAGVMFSDPFPAGLVIATPNGLTGSCGGGTIVATAGSGNVSLSGATLAGGANCTFSVNVTSALSGSYTNTTGAASSLNGGTGNTATASLTVISAPSIAKAFGAPTIPVNGTTSLTLTINNPNNNAVALNGLSFTDSLPAGLVVATPNALTNTCGGTATATAGTGAVSLTGGVLAASSPCTVSVNVTGTTVGIKNNIVTVSSSNGGTGNSASTLLTVVSPPTIAKAFGAPTIPLNGTTSLTFTIGNSNATVALTGIAFTDTLPAGLVVATPNGLTSTCGGSPTATAGSSSVSLAGGTLAASGTCTLSINVTGTTAGVKNNITGAVSSIEGGTGLTASASVTAAAPPTISKAFGAASIPLNGSTSLTFTIGNPSATVAFTGVSFTDALPAGLVVATPSALASNCNGTATATAGSASVSLTGGTLAAGGTCTLSINVTGSAAGVKNNVTGAVSSTEGGTGGTASASTTVVAPPSIAKSFPGGSTCTNSPASLSFTITNPNTASTLTGVAFTDALPAGLVVATPNGITGSCGGGSITAAAGSGSVSLSGSSLAASGSCTFSVNVTSSASGSYTNTTGAVSSTNGGSGNTATAALTVNAPLSITQQPTSVVVGFGLQASLKVTVTGTITSYQWQKNGTNIAGANAATYTIGFATSSDSGQYDVVVTGPCGTVTSSAVKVTVGNKPVILSIVPPDGPASGSQTVTINGLNLANVQSVTFGGVPATIQSASNNSIVVITPPHDPGTVDVRVQTSVGATTFVASYTFSPLDLPIGASVIPAVGSAPGAFSSFFRTAIQLYDPSSSAITGNIVYHVQAVRGSNSDPALAFNLPSGSVQSIPDFLPALGLTGLGSADVVPTSGQTPLSVIRIFNDAGSAGTTGMTLDPVSDANTLQSGDTAVLIAPSNPNAFRYNIGIRSLALGVTLQITLRDQNGNMKQTLSTSYPPIYFEQFRAADLLGVTPAGNDSISFNVMSGSAVIYGVTVDNKTQDPSAQIPRRLVASATGPYIIPVIGSTPAQFGSYFKTEMQLHNPWTAPVTGSVVFHVQGTPAAAGDPALAFNIAPGQTLDFPDVLAAINVTGIGSADLNVTSASGPVSVIRIFNDGGSAGTVGMTIDPASSGDALLAGDTGVLIAPADATNFRFNIGIRTLDAGATMQLMVHGQDGTLKLTVAKSFGVNTFVQTSAAALLGMALAPNDTISFTINSGSAVIYGATTDNRSQDPSYQLAKKRF